MGARTQGARGKREAVANYVEPRDEGRVKGNQKMVERDQLI